MRSPDDIPNLKLAHDLCMAFGDAIEVAIRAHERRLHPDAPGAVASAIPRALLQRALREAEAGDGLDTAYYADLAGCSVADFRRALAAHAHASG